jgi:hypothetical protein
MDVSGMMKYIGVRMPKVDGDKMYAKGQLARSSMNNAGIECVANLGTLMPKKLFTECFCPPAAGWFVTEYVSVSVTVTRLSFQKGDDKMQYGCMYIRV